MKKKSVAILVAAVVLVGCLLSFFGYSYYNPEISLFIGRSSAESGRYVESMLSACDGKFNMPIPKSVLKNYRTFHEQAQQLFVTTVEDLKNNYNEPIHVELSYVVKDGQTILSYNGTATSKESGQSVDYHREMVFDFVMSHDVKLK